MNKNKSQEVFLRRGKRWWGPTSSINLPIVSDSFYTFRGLCSLPITMALESWQRIDGFHHVLQFPFIILFKERGRRNLNLKCDDSIFWPWKVRNIFWPWKLRIPGPARGQKKSGSVHSRSKIIWFSQRRKGIFWPGQKPIAPPRISIVRP